MPSIPEAIGTFFEEKLLASLPNLQDFRDCENAPDFRWEDVWLEAKVGFRDFGALPKEYQFALHKRFRPFVYACGYHDFAGAMTRLKGGELTDMVEQLHSEAHIERVFFVSASVMESMYAKDFIISRKEKRPYCQFQARDFERVVRDEVFMRAGTQVQAREFYNVRNCRYSDSDPIGYILIPSHYDRIMPKLERIITAELFNGMDGQRDRKSGSAGI